MLLNTSSAYEIASYWGEEPPPREILEDLTAKGGDLRSRTIETFPIPNRGLGDDGQESGEDELRTPRTDKMKAEEPGSGGRYPTSKCCTWSP